MGVLSIPSTKYDTDYFVARAFSLTSCRLVKLNKHIQRANYQASIWKTSPDAYSDIPSPVGHGWFIDGSDITIDWIDVLPAPLAVLELLSCRCATKCSNNRCACFQNKLQCTDACGCDKNKCENQIIQSETDDENDTDNESASDEE